ncbi:hypothetical protein GIV19_04235 [Pseudomonas syringae]|uniref:hypothetical protein n=1 Tax=Pseudomonas syringae TaxID=317 RepID=UPI001F9A6060|nr:hypothetical protein [Pseudomonas syringae]
MREKVPALVASPRIDVEDPGALLVIKRHLNGETNLSPASLRNDPFYRAQFELVAKGIAGRMDDQINSLNRQKQSILDGATGRQGASYFQFEAKVARDRRLYAHSPDALDDINWAVSRHRQLDAEENSLIHQSADVGRLIDTIRSSFNAR